ncbi:MAG: methylated-DNA--[protein]-cysteine S-methyltransferase [Nitrososphaerota archaeon]|jgi:O-6-methylguanine DNA methyltransferase|nr:methylated-DNA--[protein]-cysteine S-methyltransferase [Nitrososphaerota archaeon]
MIQIYTQTANDTWLAIACTKQIIATSFATTEQKALNNILNKLPFNVPFQILPSPSAYAQDTFILMTNILDGKKIISTFDLATDKLPKYTTTVLKAVMQIPIGYVSTYGAVAKAVGGGSRAVGNIMAGNIFAPLIPCHRVVKANLSLGGYGGGLKTKYHLLMKEKRGYPELKNITIKNGGVLQIYPVEITLSKASKIFNPV